MMQDPFGQLACLQLLAHDFIGNHLLHLALLATLHHLQSLGLLLNLTGEAADYVAQPFWPYSVEHGWQLLRRATAEAARVGSPLSEYLSAIRRWQTPTQLLLVLHEELRPTALTASTMQHSQPQTGDAAAHPLNA